MEPGEIRVERTAMAEDVMEVLKQNRMVLELNKKVLDMILSASGRTIWLNKPQDPDLKENSKVESFSEL